MTISAVQHLVQNLVQHLAKVTSQQKEPKLVSVRPWPQRLSSTYKSI